MTRPRFPVTIVLTLACLVVSTGCEDSKQKMTLLEQTNQQLMDELNDMRDQLLASQRTSSDCQGELDRARGDMSGLHQQLANARRPVVQPQPRPQPQVQPQTPPGWQVVPGGAMIAIDDSVLFASGKAKIRKDADKIIGRLASDLNGQYSGKDILVFGHTDNQPIKKSGWKDNYQLSTERSLAVVRMLKQRGVDPARLVACGCGEHRPRVPNTSASNRRKNRRVEIFALEAETRTARR